MQCSLAVQRGRNFEPHPRQPSAHAFEKTDVHLARFVLAHARDDFDARGPQTRRALAVDLRVGVAHGQHHASNASLDERVTTRPRAALVAAGLQRDISRCALCGVTQRLRIAQRHDLCMRLSRRLGVALPNDVSVIDQHAAHTRIGRGEVERLLGQAQGLGHERNVVVAGHGAIIRLSAANTQSLSGLRSSPRVHPRGSNSNCRKRRQAVRLVARL